MSTRIVVAIGLFASGCGDVVNHLADAPVANDVTPIDGSIADAPPPRCDPAKAFGAPVAVTELNSGAQEGGISLSSDELTAVFASTRAGGPGMSDIYIAQRATRTAAWGAPSLLAGVNTAAMEGRPSLTADGLSLYAEFQLNANSSYELVRATRATAASAFGAMTPVTVLNSTAADYEPWVTPDNSAVYFSSTRGVNGDDELYAATGSAGSFGAPQLVLGSGLLTASAESYPVLTADQLNIYFRSDRTGSANTDVWFATRASLAVGFAAPVNVSQLNTAAGETPDWVTADNCVIYFHRIVGQVAPNNELYVATKPL